ncbi:MAG: PHP domain-containing protein [Candidatus Pacebacteria bacterium]|nr:PHP domain-containing protein [Candidatus Paceibacterota bacterium]
MKIDLHCHTKYSYDASSSIESIISQGKKMGLDGIAITDHENTNGWDEAIKLGKKQNFLIVLGEEMKTTKGDVLGLFLKQRIDGYKKDPRWVMEEIKKQGGLVIIPHPFHGSEGFRDDITKYLDLVDAVEIFNARKPGTSPDKKAKEFAEKNNLGMTAGSDSHYHKGIGYTYVEFQGNTEEELKLAILNRDTKIKEKKSPLIYILTPFLAKTGIIKR